MLGRVTDSLFMIRVTIMGMIIVTPMIIHTMVMVIVTPMIMRTSITIPMSTRRTLNTRMCMKIHMNMSAHMDMPTLITTTTMRMTLFMSIMITRCVIVVSSLGKDADEALLQHDHEAHSHSPTSSPTHPTVIVVRRTWLLSDKLPLMVVS